MFGESIHTVVSAITLLAVIMWAAPVASAQEPAPPADDSNCQTCHENLYYLYDTGKWHCLCSATPSCLHCHGGQPGTLDEAEAHAGMLANPLQEDAAVCQQCHLADCQEHVDQFLAVAGGTVMSGPGRMYPTPFPVPTSAPAALSDYRLPGQLSQPWRLAALGLTGMLAAGLGLAATTWRRTYRHAPIGQP